MRKLSQALLLLLFLSSYTFAQTKVIDSLKVVLHSTSDTTKVFVLNQIAKAYEFVDDKAMFDYSVQAKTLAEKLNYKNGLAKALCNIGTYYSRINELETAIQLFKQSLATVDPKDTYLQVVLLHNISIHESNDMKSKLSSLEKSIALAKQIKFRQIGFLYQSMGNYHYDRGNFKTAYPYYLEGLKMAEKNKDSVSISLNLDGIGAVLDANDDKNSFTFCLCALRMAEQMKNNLFIAMCKNTLAVYYRKKGNLDTALILNTQALQLAKKINSPERIITSLNSIGYTYYLKKNYPVALRYYKRALDLIPPNHNVIDAANVFSNLGTLYSALGDYKKAISYLEESVSISQNFESKDNLITLYQALANAHYKTSNYKKAYEYYGLYKATHDSVYNVEAGKQIASLQAKHELKKKEQDIKMLEQHNKVKDLTISQGNIKILMLSCLFIVIVILSILLFSRYKIKQKATIAMQKVNYEILKMMNEKEVLIQEIHHRTKNNLQLVSGLLTWQTENIEDEQTLKILNEGRSRIKSMALIHELLYQSNNLAHLELDRYIIKLLDYLEKLYNPDRKITIIKNINPVLAEVDITIPLGLIITELVSNSFKYAFNDRKQGIIEVSLIEENSFIYQLHIKDNGKGIPEKILNDCNRKSMGLELVKILVKQIKGHLDFQNVGGASVCISFSNIQCKEKPKEVVG
jgi:two-component sensor histidine kinase